MKTHVGNMTKALKKLTAVCSNVATLTLQCTCIHNYLQRGRHILNMPRVNVKNIL